MAGENCYPHCWHEAGRKAVVVERHGPFAPRGGASDVEIRMLERCCNCATERTTPIAHDPEPRRWDRPPRYRLTCSMAAAPPVLADEERR